VQDLKKHTPESHPDYKNIGTALEKMEEMAQRINDAKKRDESFRRMTDIDKKLRGDLEVTLNHDPSNNIAAFFFFFGLFWCLLLHSRCERRTRRWVHRRSTPSRRRPLPFPRGPLSHY
jgi:hypothetical protein